MTITQMDRLVDEQNRIWNRMQEIQGRAESEGRDWTAEERANWDEANTRIDVVSADIERLEKFANRSKVDYRQVVQGSGSDDPADVRDGKPEDRAAKEAEKYDVAFRGFMRGGMDALNTEQRQTLLEHRASPQSVGVPADGGYLVPPGYRHEMTESLKAYGGLINLANVITTSTGQPLQWPTNDDTNNTGAILNENTQITELGVTIGTRALGAYTYTSKLVRVSLQLLQDSAFNLDTWLPRKLGQRIGRAVAADLITGTGTGMPTGILPGATTGVAAVAQAVFTTPSATNDALLYDALISLEHSVDPAYRASSPATDDLGPAAGVCRFLFSDITLSRIRKAKDSQNRPLYLPVPTPGVPATINGNPYTIDQGMPSTYTTTGTKPVLFGNFFEGYVVRQALDVQAVRLTERYADFLQVGFFGFMRLDATPDDAAAVKAITLA